MLIQNVASSLKTLPSSPSQKIGWPWTEESNLLNEYRPDGSRWPKITIVTPSYNQGTFLEETIRSILLQRYPNLEYIIIDGGSRDQSIEIIQKYSPWLSYWTSEKDAGQSDAINKGFSRSTGTIMGWVNSDDLLTPNCLYHLALAYEPGLKWWTGGASQMLQDGKIINYNYQKLTTISHKEFLHARALVFQIATFWTQDLWREAGAHVTALNYAMDYELWLRFSKLALVIPIYQNLGIYRTHDAAKTGTESGQNLHLSESNMVRIKEYEKLGLNNHVIRSILITLWTRYSLAKQYGWRSWIGRRSIPYV